MATNMNISGCCNSDTSPKPQSLSLCPAAIEQFRQLGEIERYLVHRQEAGVSCSVWIGSTNTPSCNPVVSSTANPLGISTIRQGAGKRPVMFPPLPIGYSTRAAPK